GFAVPRPRARPWGHADLPRPRPGAVPAGPACRPAPGPARSPPAQRLLRQRLRSLRARQLQRAAAGLPGAPGELAGAAPGPGLSPARQRGGGPLRELDSGVRTCGRAAVVERRFGTLQQRPVLGPATRTVELRPR